MYHPMSRMGASCRVMSTPSDGPADSGQVDEGRPLAAAPWLCAPECRELVECIAARGGEARFVGGCVRDGLLDPKGDISDLDVATTLLPEEVEGLVDRTIPTGFAHGTVTVRLGAHSFEVTTLRRDVACDGRHAEVVFTESFEEDAGRRDFTINAMSCDIEGRLFDYFGGAADLAAGRVRFVGDPARRIREDYLRILRFFRFYARFGCPELEPELELEPERGQKWEPEPETLEAIRAATDGLRHLSGERVQAELLRLLAHPRCAESVRLMEETGVLAALLGEGCNIARLEKLTTLDAGFPEGAALRRLASLLRLRRDPNAVALQLKLSRNDTRRLVNLTRGEPPDLEAGPPAWREAVYRSGQARMRDLALIAAARPEGESWALARVMATIDSFEPPAFPVTGDDLLAYGMVPGPELGEIYAMLEDWWVKSDCAPDREQCLAQIDRLRRIRR